MVKMVIQLFSAAFAELTFTDLSCIFFFLLTLLSDTKRNIFVTGIFCKKCRKCIIAIYDKCHIRSHMHGFLEQFHRNINLPVTVELITEKIGQNHIVRFKIRQNSYC